MAYVQLAQKSHETLHVRAREVARLRQHFCDPNSDLCRLDKPEWVHRFLQAPKDKLLKDTFSAVYQMNSIDVRPFSEKRIKPRYARSVSFTNPTRSVCLCIRRAIISVNTATEKQSNYARLRLARFNLLVRISNPHESATGLLNSFVREVVSQFSR